MSDALTIIRRLHDHRLWTRLRLLEATSELSEAQLRTPFPMGIGSAFATLEHVHGAERVWLGVLLDDPGLHFPDADEFGGLSGLLRAWSELDARWESYLAGLGAAELDRVIRRPNRSGGISALSVEDILIHVCTHGFYHAAQLSNMLRTLGATPPGPTDFAAMARERHAAMADQVE